MAKQYKRIDEVIILGIGDCFKPYVDMNDDKEVLFIHESPDQCSACNNYWRNIETDG